MTEKNPYPPIAPSYMRPQQPVLDEILDIDRGQKVVSSPFEAYSGSFHSETNVVTDEPLPAVMPEIQSVEDTIEAEQTSPVSEVEEMAASVNMVEETPIPEFTQNEKSSKRLTPFQRVIVGLLVVVVVLLLTIVYLYLTGRIELRPEILPTFEGLLDQDLIKRFIP